MIGDYATVRVGNGKESGYMFIFTLALIRDAAFVGPKWNPTQVLLIAKKLESRASSKEQKSCDRGCDLFIYLFLFFFRYISIRWTTSLARCS